jgi:5-methylthioadenosine/S-adenosylhomocysteine deaminase
MNTAALLGKLVAGDAEALPAASVLRMATINGARALGLDQQTGSLEPGKAADAVCVRLTDPCVQPVLDPLSQLVYAAGRDQVTDVWVGGEHLVVDAALARMDEKLLLERVEFWASRILET